MKNIKIIALTALFAGVVSFADVTQLKEEDAFALMEKGAARFGEKTKGKGCPNYRPDLSGFDKGTGFFAKMDSFGMDRYYIFRNDTDIDRLIDSQTGGLLVRLRGIV